jgi:5-methylcytosine-specific restriction endonuclease McrA
VANKPHHRDPRYVRLAALVRAQAYADPTTRCWRCGLTLDEVRRTNPRARWDAGHLVDGSILDGLRAECSPCNRAAGARMVNARRASGFQW